MNVQGAILGIPALVLICLLVTASLFDLKLRRVPNSLILTGSTLALLFVASGLAAITLVDALLGGLAGLCVFILPYAIGKMGAGDVKLLGMSGLFLGPLPVLSAALYTMLAGGFLALFYLMYRCCGARCKTSVTVPYAVAISLGVFFVLAGY